MQDVVHDSLEQVQVVVFSAIIPPYIPHPYMNRAIGIAMSIV